MSVVYPYRTRSYKRQGRVNRGKRYIMLARRARQTRMVDVVQSYHRRVQNARTGGFLGIESKFIDSTFDNGIVATVTSAEADPAGGSLAAIAQGDGESNRDGRKCTLTSLHMKGQVQLNSTSGASSQQPGVARVIVVWDTQTNGAALSSENVMTDPTHKEFAFRNLQFFKRFKILKDQTFTINPAAGAGDGGVNDFGAIMQNFNWNFRFRIPVIHNGTTAAITTITDNSLHVIAFASSTLMTLRYEARTRFVG